MRVLLFVLCAFSALAYGVEPDWSENARLATKEDKSDFKARENIYQLDEIDYINTIQSGKMHALQYPVKITGLLIPLKPTEFIFETQRHDPIRRYIFKIARRYSKLNSIDDLFNWIGLNKLPETAVENPYNIPIPQHLKQYPMGTTIIKNKNGTGLTFSCAACHSNDLFGKKILGLTNRFPRANEIFYLGKMSSKFINPHLFQLGLKTTKGERLMVKKSKNNLKWVEVKVPLALGLDTSLAQVGLSLSRRGLDPYASKLQSTAIRPRTNGLRNAPADSKPAVWWNLKYKTRWLSDGSIVSGNPIFTNFLWNEIGRGTDLKELEQWMKYNQQTIKELTASVFATQAPKWWDILPIEKIDYKRAKRGEKIFKISCQKCHGQYIKHWSDSDAQKYSYEKLLSTKKIIYHAQTPVKDVGTDPYRYQGMKYFAKRLNDLKISKMMKTKVVPQKGYVPPPLEGIWSRWPYFHNNSIPNLCALMTAPEKRPETYYSGKAQIPERDFDFDCVGYPVGDKAPSIWKKKDYFFNTKVKGLSNSGHYYRIFTDKEGREKYSVEDKKDLLEFLKTL
jgi:mono/diheme cytochrome c family protein